MLFKSPASRIQTLGVTVRRVAAARRRWRERLPFSLPGAPEAPPHGRSPVRIRSLRDFGTVAVVASKLLAAEKEKESTLSVALLAASERSTAAGDVEYDLSYDLISSYTHKVVRNAVCVCDGQLYILNLQYEAGDEGAAAAAAADAVVDAFQPGAAAAVAA